MHTNSSLLTRFNFRFQLSISFKRQQCYDSHHKLPMPFRRRRVWVPLTVLAVLLAIAGALYLRQQEAPEAARLLPESDAIVYFNLKPVRLATNFGDKTVM